MAILAAWAGVLVAGDYLSPVEIPMLAPGGRERYLQTLERLRPLVRAADHVVPGHGPVMAPSDALEVLDQDVAYLSALGELGAGAALPREAASPVQRKIHAENVRALEPC
jgi:glyoxylase-like metal-dependent hydrolase (beta-lactamase superfamily II)